MNINTLVNLCKAVFTHAAANLTHPVWTPIVSAVLLCVKPESVERQAAIRRQEHIRSRWFLNLHWTPMQGFILTVIFYTEDSKIQNTSYSTVRKKPRHAVGRQRFLWEFSKLCVLVTTPSLLSYRLLLLVVPSFWDVASFVFLIKKKKKKSQMSLRTESRS